MAIGNRVADIPISRYLGERFSTTDAQQIQGRYWLEHTFNDVWSLRNTVRVLTAEGRRFSADAIMSHRQPSGTRSMGK